MSGVLIVGAGLAGARCAETLRAEGYEGRIVLAGEEPVAPYERPALSKELLAGARGLRDLFIRPPGSFAEADIELRLGVRIERIDVERRLAWARGKELHWHSLVLATGARARTLPGLEGPRVHRLRTLADAVRLRDELRPGLRLAVVGAGFIGAEAASTALALGASVTMIEAAPAPLLRIVGPEVAALLASRYSAAGVDLRLGVGVAGLRADGLLLADGSRVPCDAVLVGVGAEPAGELAGAGEVLTDDCGRTALPGVYACGDVARWAGRRTEHWTSASGQGVAVARAIAGRPEPFADLPYFWSDQFGLRLQMVGHADHFAAVELDGDERSFCARFLGVDGRPLAALLANRPAEVAALRRELAAAA